MVQCARFHGFFFTGEDPWTMPIAIIKCNFLSLSLYHLGIYARIQAVNKRAQHHRGICLVYVMP